LSLPILPERPDGPPGEGEGAGEAAPEWGKGMEDGGTFRRGWDGAGAPKERESRSSSSAWLGIVSGGSSLGDVDWSQHSLESGTRDEVGWVDVGVTRT
jgi:hypothetical protein